MSVFVMALLLMAKNWKPSNALPLMNGAKTVAHPYNGILLTK